MCQDAAMLEVTFNPWKGFAVTKKPSRDFNDHPDRPGLHEGLTD
jgi:hypothetical protein